ncbi:hypothetical protein E4P24_16125 [Haloferax sp. AS1]|uniref:hypothetical protein n=1 Tax=Haloferax TaxID=2251 RepID=UPI00165EF190|nr:hypothetical protein [Haloferax sp. AS1]MBC9987883.1 hypothetical protein [Haloferax sp. AS1]
MGLIDAAADIVEEISDEGTGQTDAGDASSGVVRASARCMYSEGPFTIRFERRGNAWAATSTSKPTGGDGRGGSSGTAQVSGQFEFPPEYEGCPHCSNTGLFVCADCDNIACWDGNTNPVVCPWCSAENPIEGDIENIEATEAASNDRSTTGSTDSGVTSGTTDSGATSEPTDSGSTSIRREE